MTSATGLPQLGAGIQWPDAAAVATLQTALPPGTGRVAEIAEWIAGAQARGAPQPPSAPRAVVLPPAPGQPAGSELAVATADRYGIGYTVPDLPDTPAAALAAGAALADACAEEGRDLLVLAAAADDTAGAVVSLITGAEPVALLPRGAAAVDTRAWIARAVALRDRLRGLTRLREAPDALLDELGSSPLAFACGLLTAAAARRTPVLIDGTLAAAAGVLCFDVQARSGQWWRLADDNPDPVHRRAAEDLAHRPVLDLGLDRADGLAGLLAVGVVQAAVAACTETVAGAR